MDERRKATRIDLNLPAHWKSPSGAEGEGTIVNCSASGCFVKTQLEEPGNEPINLAIQLPDGKALSLWGRVAFYLPAMGFGLHFTPRSGEGQTMLQKWLEYLQANTPLRS